MAHIFLFKQKTAYEIKECDWSSDVCSSDLVAVHLARHPYTSKLIQHVSKLWLDVQPLERGVKRGGARVLLEYCQR